MRKKKKMDFPILPLLYRTDCLIFLSGCGILLYSRGKIMKAQLSFKRKLLIRENGKIIAETKKCRCQQTVDTGFKISCCSIDLVEYADIIDQKIIFSDAVDRCLHRSVLLMAVAHDLSRDKDKLRTL